MNNHTSQQREDVAKWSGMSENPVATRQKCVDVPSRLVQHHGQQHRLSLTGRNHHTENTQIRGKSPCVAPLLLQFMEK